MKHIETTNGYDICELTKTECEKMWYSYPTFAVFLEGEEHTLGFEETTEESLKLARKWCEHFSRT